MASSGGGKERVLETIPLVDRIDQYLPPIELLYEYPRPGPAERELKKRLEEQLPGAKYVLTYSPLLNSLIFTPPWHPLNMDPKETPGRDYAQVVFEGGSMEPVLNEQGEIVAGNIILHGPKQERLKKSVYSHGFESKVDLKTFDQGIRDLASVLGKDVLISKEGMPSRAYIRPSIGRSAGRYGVRPLKDHEVDQTAVIFNWPFYLEPAAYLKGEKVALFIDQQRLTPIVAKEARNYGNGSVLTERAKKVGVGEILFFGPYTIDKETREIREYVNVTQGAAATEKLIQGGVLADGMGEEILGIAGKTLVYPPLDTNRLGGTTLQYIIDYLAPTIGFKTQEYRFTLQDIKEGMINALLFLGNAVKVCPIEEIRVCDKNGILEIVKLNPGNPYSKQIVERFSKELSGEIPPSHGSLHTRVEFSPKARAKLDKFYNGWV